jgi:DNA-binding MarR family transcriptional regulator
MLNETKVHAMHINSTLKDVIIKVISPIKGVKPSFNEYHVLKALLVLYEKGPLGRQLLSRYLGLSTTSVRTLVNRLKKLNIIETDPVAGCILTVYGQSLVERIQKLVVFGKDASDILEKNLLLYNKAYSFLLRKGLELLKQFSVSYLRDTIIKYKAKAVIIAYVQDDKVYIPPYRDLNEDLFPSLKKIKNLLAAQNLDIIVIIFAEDEKTAEEAFLLTLLELNVL